MPRHEKKIDAVGNEPTADKLVEQVQPLKDTLARLKHLKGDLGGTALLLNTEGLSLLEILDVECSDDDRAFIDKTLDRLMAEFSEGRHAPYPADLPRPGGCKGEAVYLLPDKAAEAVPAALDEELRDRVLRGLRYQEMMPLQVDHRGMNPEALELLGSNRQNLPNAPIQDIYLTQRFGGLWCISLATLPNPKLMWLGLKKCDAGKPEVKRMTGQLLKVWTPREWNSFREAQRQVRETVRLRKMAATLSHPARERAGLIS